MSSYILCTSDKIFKLYPSSFFIHHSTAGLCGLLSWNQIKKVRKKIWMENVLAPEWNVCEDIKWKIIKV